MKTLKLFGCINLTKFPAFGQLPSLEELHITKAIKVKHIGFEFYSFNRTLEHENCRVPFPKLKKLLMREMVNLEVWELQHGVVMPCLTSIRLEYCPKLKALPALGKLPSLDELVIGAIAMTHIGCEFLYEVDEEAAGGERFNNIAFPKLKSLTMGSEEVEWEFGVIEVLSKMSSLEILEIGGEAIEFIKYIQRDDLHIARETETIFPNLKTLILYGMKDMEELKIGYLVMPLLSSLEISSCYKLKSIQGGSLSKLESLTLQRCASLYELGIPNLKSLHIIVGPVHPSLPEAFATTLQSLEDLFINCLDDTWTCILEQVQQLTSLKKLELWCYGKELKKRTQVYNYCDIEAGLCAWIN